MKKVSLLISIYLVFLIGIQLKAQNYIGLETNSIAITGRLFELDNNKLFISTPNSGVACIDLKTSNLLGLLNDYDPGSYFSMDYEIYEDKIYRKNMEVFDINTFELIESLPFDEVLLIDVTETDILTITADGQYQIINKSDYTDIKTLD